MFHDRKRLFEDINELLSTNANMKLCEIAHKLAVNRQIIEKTVQQIRGQTFRMYQRGKRVEQAQHMLRERMDLEIKEICSNMGYHSHSAFSRFVKAMTGKRPKDIRNCLL